MSDGQEVNFPGDNYSVRYSSCGNCCRPRPRETNPIIGDAVPRRVCSQSAELELGFWALCFVYWFCGFSSEIFRFDRRVCRSRYFTRTQQSPVVMFVPSLSHYFRDCTASVQINILLPVFSAFIVGLLVSLFRNRLRHAIENPSAVCAASIACQL